MRPLASFLSTGESVGVALGAALVLMAAGVAVRAYIRSRPNAAELERRRRKMLHATGKMGDATLIEIREKHLFYSYDVRGVGYTASQDTSTLEALLPSDLYSVMGPALVKYDARNPANSIIISEEWSGLRTAPRRS